MSPPTNPEPQAIDVYPIGSPVLLGSVSARITAIFIRANQRITYEVVYWNDRERKEEVVESWEIQPDNDLARTQRINPVL